MVLFITFLESLFQIYRRLKLKVFTMVDFIKKKKWIGVESNLALSKKD